jgi:hypothetical protein
MQWLTENNFADGRYYLRVQGWDLVAGNLANPRILPLCGTEDDNYVVLRVDNRLNPDPGHVPPATPNHPCGSGTIHTCTLEPDTDFVAVKLIRGGTEINIAACGNEKVHPGDILRVDFIADDPNNHLAYYSLTAIYAENLAVDLLALGGTLTPLGWSVSSGGCAGRAELRIGGVWSGLDGSQSGAHGSGLERRSDPTRGSAKTRSLKRVAISSS